MSDISMGDRGPQANYHTFQDLHDGHADMHDASCNTLIVPEWFLLPALKLRTYYGPINELVAQQR
jgi:hypothetical protein